MKHGSLFSGIGGFDLGARMSGIETLWNCEIDEHKRKVLKRHFPNTMQYEDIKQIRNPAYVEIISGGFPCQDISIANQSKKVWENGKIKGINGDRSGLWREYNRLLGEIRPKYIVFENSPMLIVRGFEQVLCDLSQSGYDCEWQCLSASQFGYNHKRERLYGIAYSREIGCKNNSKIFRELQEVFSEKTPRQTNIPMPTKRFNSRSDYRSVRMVNGFSSGLDKRRIEDLGNSIIPEIAHYLFECIKYHDNQNS